ncbi:MAG: copper chaperone PCu(A)C [Rhodospirillales bacterium]|nr:copper chaperone PCu(A)C [Rhodospirillales bacterium]
MISLRRVLFVAAFAAFPFAALAQSGGVTVENPFARPSAGTAGAGAAYMTIRNPGPADRLVAAASPAARAAELHTHIREGDVMRMRKVEAIEIPASGAAELKPGGLHVMLMGLVRPLKTGDAFALTLTFEKSGAVTIQVPVKEMGAGAPMPHGMTKH